MLFTLVIPAMAATPGAPRAALENETVPTPDDAPATPENALTATAEADGETVTLTVKTTEALLSGKITVAYPAGMKLVDAAAPSPEAGVSTVNTTVAGQITVAWGTAAKVSDEETILTATFTADSGDYTFTTTPAKLYNGEETVEARAFDTTVTVVKTHDCPSAAFTDVSTTDWFHEAVDYVVAEKLMIGTSNTTFEPNSTLSRATVVTVLYRMAGSPDVASDASFSDVAAGLWYSDAIAWAAEKAIAKGYEDGSFWPDTNVSRQDTAVFLYRYADMMGFASTAADTLSDFADEKDVAPYAKEAMLWAVSNGIIQGTTFSDDGILYLAPAYTATRAEFAQMIMRLKGLEPIPPAEYTLTFQGEHAVALVDGKVTTSMTVTEGAQVTFRVDTEGGYELAGVTAGEKALTPDGDGNYTVTVESDLTVGMLAVEKVLPPAPETCTITLLGENLEFYQGEQQVDRLTVEKGTKYVTFNALGINGYHATTATASNGAEVINVGNLFVISNITGDATVTVDTELNVYTVTFSYRYSASYKTADQEVTHGQTATAPSLYPEPCRTGQHLKGWYADEELTTEFDFSTPITGNTTIYSDWIDNVYTVTFHSNGGSEVAPVQVVHGKTIAAPEKPTHPDGYAFAGWYSDEELTVPFKFANTYIRQDTDLYAKWFDGQYQDIYLDGTKNGDDANGGTSAADAVKTFARAKELLSQSSTGVIRVTGTVTIPANTEETWTLNDVSEEACIVRDASNTSSIVLTNGKLTLENITIKGSNNQETVKARLFDPGDTNRHAGDERRHDPGGQLHLQRL